MPATRARDRDPRGEPTDLCTADVWLTVSSAVFHSSPPVSLSSSSLENFARDQRIRRQVSRQDRQIDNGKIRKIYHSRFIVGRGRQCIHLFGFRIVINIREARSRTSADVDKGRVEKNVSTACTCLCVRVYVYAEEDQETTYNHARNSLRHNPSRHSSRLAPGDRLNQGSSSCALSSLGTAIRPTSDTLDGARHRPATLGTRSESSPSRYARNGLRSPIRIPTAKPTPTRGHGQEKLQPNARIMPQSCWKRNVKLGFYMDEQLSLSHDRFLPNYFNIIFYQINDE